MSCQVVSIHTNVARSRIDSFTDSTLTVLQQRGSPSVFGAHAAAQVVVDVQPQMRLELSGPSALGPGFAEPAGPAN